MVNSPGAAALAEKPTDAGLWLASLPDRRTGRSPEAVSAAQGVLADLAGAVTDLAVGPDGRFVAAAHAGRGTVSVIDAVTLSLHARVEVDEPHALAAAADRCYVTSAGLDEDTVVAIDATGGVPLAGREIGASARGLAVSPSGTTLYVARCTEGGADIAVIDVESGNTVAIPVAETPDAVVDAVRTSPDGRRLYAARTTAAGSALVVMNTRTRRVLHTVDVCGSVGDIAVHADGRRVLATGWDSDLGGVLTLLDAAGARVVDTIAMGGPATQVVLGPSRAYVVSGERIVVVDVASMRVVETLSADAPAACIALSADATTLYIGGFDATVTALRVGADRLRAAS